MTTTEPRDERRTTISVQDGPYVYEYMVFVPDTRRWWRRLSVVHPVRKWRRAPYPPDTAAVEAYLLEKWGLEAAVVSLLESEDGQ